MRTNIDIDDELLAKAMHAGPYTTKKETVEAGLRLLARQAAYREILKWKGKLKWEGDESVDWTQPAQEEPEAPVHMVQEPRAAYRVGKAPAAGSGGKQRKAARGAGR
ncbi:MAG: type II toxin-antitoxin system VapB family antitoxin [Ottowia sp.]|uniref:type II toxin-antitoxin system VapB family antitoxin n=1 Tax=Ottowia sp. TaxID=1898956 RepID=UPI0039E436D0